MDADELLGRILPNGDDARFRGRQGDGLPSLEHETHQINGGHQGGSQNTQNLGRIIPPQGGSGITKPTKGEGKK